MAGPLSSSFAKGTDTYIIPWLYYSRFIVEKEEKREENTKEMCNTRSCKSRPRLCQGSRHFQRFGRRGGRERSWPVGNPTTVKNITKEKRDFSLLFFERKIKLDGKNLYPLKKILQFACPHFFWRFCLLVVVVVVAVGCCFVSNLFALFKIPSARMTNGRGIISLENQNRLKGNLCKSNHQWIKTTPKSKNKI